jgi:hypothetical protein
MMKANDPEHLALIRVRRGEGKTLEQIGQEVGVSRERIRQICDANNISKAETRQPFVPLTCQVCGESYERIRNQTWHGYESYTDHYYRTGHRPHPRTLKPWVQTMAQARIVALHGQGLTVTQIADTSGYSRGLVSRTLRRAGLAGSYNVERDTAIIEDWKKGVPYTVLMERYQLCYARVRQIIEGFLGSGLPRQSSHPWTRRRSQPLEK